MYGKLALHHPFQYDVAIMPKLLKGRKKKTSIYVDQARLTALKNISDRTLISVSVLIRKGIDLVIAEYSKAK